MPEVEIQTDVTPQDEARNTIFDEIAHLDHDLATLLQYTNKLIQNHRIIRRAILQKESISSENTNEYNNIDLCHPEDPPSLDGIPHRLSLPPIDIINNISFIPSNLQQIRYSDIVSESLPIPPSPFILSHSNLLIRTTQSDSLSSPQSSSSSSSSPNSSQNLLMISSTMNKNHRYSPY